MRCDFETLFRSRPLVCTHAFSHSTRFLLLLIRAGWLAAVSDGTLQHFRLRIYGSLIKLCGWLRALRHWDRRGILGLTAFLPRAYLFRAAGLLHVLTLDLITFCFAIIRMYSYRTFPIPLFCFFFGASFL